MRKPRLFFLFFILFLLTFFLGIYTQKKGILGKYIYPILQSNIKGLSNYFSALNQQVETIKIYILKEDYRQLEKQRQKALERGINIDNDNYINGIFSKGKSTDIKGKIKLKGVLKDHWEEDNKWSLKIKLKNGKINRVNNFSLIVPIARNYIYEWLFLQFLNKEKILTPKSKFVKLSINNINKGIMFFEEDYSTNMFDHPSPIICFDKDYFVESWLSGQTSDMLGRGSFESRPITAVGEKKILSDSVLFKYFQKAVSNLEKLRLQEIQIDKTIDISKFSKYLAVRAILGSSEFDPNDNKFYYNPTTGLLEPIGMEINRTRFGKTENWWFNQSNLGNRSAFGDIFFNSNEFYRLYLKSLYRMTNKNYVDSIIKSIQPNLNKNLNRIYLDYPFFNFDLSETLNNVKSIHQSIVPKGHLINAYFNYYKDETISIELGNIHILPIEVNKLIIDNIEYTIKDKILNAKKIKDSISYQTITQKINYLHRKKIIIEYSVLGTGQVKSIIVNPWRRKGKLSNEN
tara:strand:- start:1420 stop:2967 length:1548 start_codon:yes stop_codon:yes gene_type:complete